MNIAETAIKFKTFSLVMTFVIIGAGYMAYEKLGRLEDPEFTIKEAQIFTQYPGATAIQVAQEVTDEIETAVQQMGQLKLVTSISTAGLSTVKVEMKDNYDKSTLPQVWDELRRKVGDMQSKLPPGTSTSIVNDDFGDVYGIFVAIYGDGYTYKELKDYADIARRELLLAQDVGKISFFGVQDEVIFVEISRAKISQLGISPDVIKATLSGQNMMVQAGKVKVGSLYLNIRPTGEFQSVEEIGDLLIIQDDATATKLYLRDLAKIWRGYTDPPKSILRYNGHPAIGLGISTAPGGNVITMCNALMEKNHSFAAKRPIGIEVGIIANQGQAVTTSIDSFVVSLGQAIAIVIAVLMITMGLRSGLIIGLILLLTVLTTFIFMQMYNIMLERISLGALIIALGMLVDNAIVVVEGILINQQRGMKPIQAASSIVKQTMWPLFGATFVAILAFAAIGASQDSTGEYCRSLFQVICISLTASWVLAITLTPLLGVMFLSLKPRADGEEEPDPYAGLFYVIYKNFLVWCMKNRMATTLVLLVLLAMSLRGFGYVEQSFFPPSTRPQFMLNYWLPQGTHIKETEANLSKVVEYLRSDAMQKNGVTNVAQFVGQGAMRFLLTYAPEERNSAYGLLLIDVEDSHKIDGLIDQINVYAKEHFSDAMIFSRKFVLGPGDPAKIHARFRGADPAILRKLADECELLMHAEPTVTDVRNDWRQRVPMIKPIVSETASRNAGITRSQIASALQMTFSGEVAGMYREDDDLLPIIIRSPEVERSNIDNLHNIQVYSPVAKRSISISQFITGFETVSEDSIIRRRDRLPCLTVKCDPKVGMATEVFAKIRPRIEKMFDEKTKQWNLTGYSLEWGGEYEDSGDAQAAIKSKLPIVGMMMVLVVIGLFNSVGKPLVIFLTVPMSIIGVTAGLLAFNQPFGFMALLGFMSLTGMLIKNAIVLIDEINLQIEIGDDPFQAIVDAGVSRVRPVSMAALTTVMGMIPLLADAFFVAMAVTIMFGLAFATVLTLIIVPVLYVMVYRIPTTPDAK